MNGTARPTVFGINTADADSIRGADVEGIDDECLRDRTSIDTYSSDRDAFLSGTNAIGSVAADGIVQAFYKRLISYGDHRNRMLLLSVEGQGVNVGYLGLPRDVGFAVDIVRRDSHIRGEAGQCVRAILHAWIADFAATHSVIGEFVRLIEDIE